MANSLDEFMKNLKAGEYNVKEISRKTGIGYNKLAGWRLGRGRPKTEDAKKIEAFFALPQYPQQSPAERIAALELDKRVLQDALLANLEILKGQNATIIQMIRETREGLVDQDDGHSEDAEGDKSAKGGRKSGGNGKPR
jgi:hypothetical protein